MPALPVMVVERFARPPASVQTSAYLAIAEKSVESFGDWRH